MFLVSVQINSIALRGKDHNETVKLLLQSTEKTHLLTFIVMKQFSVNKREKLHLRKEK